ncbi:hypothetical protein OSTOST_24495, partial [Ostertagia ostertagi]
MAAIKRDFGSLETMQEKLPDFLVRFNALTGEEIL